MTELVLIACPKTAPDLCEERRLQGMPESTALVCMMQSLPQIAQWSAAHSHLFVDRWTCEDASSRSIDA